MSTLELGTLQAELGTLVASGALGAFTPITVTASYSAQGSADVGTVTFTLTQSVQNGTVIVPCSPLIVSLDANGTISAVLIATDDPGTAPQGVWYGVTEQITGAQPRDYFIQVSAAGPNPVTLAPPSTLPWL